MQGTSLNGRAVKLRKLHNDILFIARLPQPNISANSRIADLLVYILLLFTFGCVMPRSQMAYDASATPLRRIFPQFLAMIVQFYGAGKTAAAIIADPAATADSLTRS